MFTPARYIAIDDDPMELSPLVDALHGLGAPCIGIRFDAAGLPAPALFTGLRILFSDLHLLRAAASAVQHYDALGSILNHCVPDHHGPYVLILWTSHEQERTALADRLGVILPADKMPLAILALDKNAFSMGRHQWDGAALQHAITQQIGAMPQLAALLSWERDVLAAANATLALVSNLIPSDKRTLALYPDALDGILSLLASAAAGASNALSDPRGSVAAVLSPLLTDRILNQPAAAGTPDLWKTAVTFPQPGLALNEVQKAEMHRMLHLAVPPGEPVGQSDWGAVIPLAELGDEAMNARFGVTGDYLREKEFKLKAERRSEGQLILIRGGAACDQAQGNAGPLPFHLGLLVPQGAVQKTSRSPAVLLCGEQFKLDGFAEPVCLLVHARFNTTIVSGDLVNWPAASMRLREQMLTTILVHTASYVMRPGTLRF